MHLQVAADDRTGALEVAAALADRTGEPVTVTVWPDVPTGSNGLAVVDLGSRHLDAGESAHRAASLAAGGGRAAHKIDSTLRGNWAAELSARHRVTGRPVLLVPALPSLGRTCVNGVVLVDGAPVHTTAAGRDPLRPIATSRPSELLGRAGVEAVALGDIISVERWCAMPAGVAVADAADDDTIEHIVHLWTSTGEVLLAGTSGVIGRSVADARPARLGVDGPVLVAVGSLHPVARRQVEVAVKAGVLRVARDALDAATAIAGGFHAVLATSLPPGDVDPRAADEAAQQLATEVRTVLSQVEPGAVVVLGGDTAAAVLGISPVRVVGSLTAGTAVVDSPSCAVPVVTRAGGFGDDRALVQLLWGTLPG